MGSKVPLFFFIQPLLEARGEIRQNLFVGFYEEFRDFLTFN